MKIKFEKKELLFYNSDEVLTIYAHFYGMSKTGGEDRLHTNIAKKIVKAIREEIIRTDTKLKKELNQIDIKIDKMFVNQGDKIKKEAVKSFEKMKKIAEDEINKSKNIN